MKRLLFLLIAVFAATVALVGCGGGKNDTQSFPIASYAGSYSAALTRATGTLSLAVATNGQITIVITDSVEGTFSGTGVANHVGGFFISCAGVGGKTVTVSGTLKGSGLGRTASGTIAGTITLAYNANFTNVPDVTVYTNHYEGRYTNGSAGNNWFGDVAADGSFTGTLLVADAPANVDITGQVFSNGSFRFTGTGNGTSYTLMGVFRLSAGNVVCEGIVKVGTSTAPVGEITGHDAIGG